MRSPASLALCALLAAAVALSLAGTARAQQRCPTGSFLYHAGVVYASEQVPASVELPPAAAVGEGQVDDPTSPDGCKRKRSSVRVVRAAGIDPGIAVEVDGRPGTLFVLGGRCSGYDGPARWDCLLRPLVFRGTAYTGVAYPPEPAPQGTVRLGESLGGGGIGSSGVTVVAIDGVDPAVAVGLEGRAGEAFLAPGVCPYERFASSLVRDDLSRCLRGPLWLVFDPLGAAPKETITAHADRRLAPELAGATVALVRLDVVADLVPRARSAAVRIGSISIGADGRATLPFTVPGVEPGLYEAVVTCKECGPAYAGRTVFPAGSIVVFEGPKKGFGGRGLVIGITVVMLLSLPLVFLAWRRSRRLRS